jgi:hypothetical protein
MGGAGGLGGKSPLKQPQIPLRCPSLAAGIYCHVGEFLRNSRVIAMWGRHSCLPALPEFAGKNAYPTAFSCCFKVLKCPESRRDLPTWSPSCFDLEFQSFRSFCSHC